MKKILVVALPTSIHTARWIRQCSSEGWEIHLFSSQVDERLHPYMPLGAFRYERTPFSRVSHWFDRMGLGIPKRFMDWFARHREFHSPSFRAVRLARTVEALRPDLIHSLEIQGAGYLVLDAKTRTRGAFPRWLVTNWGSDIYLFSRLQAHQARLRAVMAQADYYQCECDRDVGLAREQGFTGEVMPVQPNAGGFDLEALRPIRTAVAPSARRLVMLKGYQGWSGRALFGLSALERCVDLLGGYTIVIYSLSDDVAIAAELFSQRTGIPVELLDKGVSHAEMLSYHARARLYLGLSISDGISTSLLEAMVMGAFPIQSCTACADEWVENGVTGEIVPPDDPVRIAEAVRMALSDDDLVDRAAASNWATAVDRLDHAKLQDGAIAMYSKLLS